MNLIEGWEKAYKLLSVQLSTLFGMLALGFEYLPMAKEYLPDDWYKYAFFLIIIARLIKQQKATE